MLNGDLLQAYTSSNVKELLSRGGVIKTGGLGNFLAFEIAVFTAQCINFPLQRNVTYKSKGNPYFQAFMYFIDWIDVSIFTNALWGIANPLFLAFRVSDPLILLLKTMLTGGVSMVIFFFIFLIIFPDLDKNALKAEKRYNKALEKNKNKEKIETLHKKAIELRNKADVEDSRMDYIKSSCLYNSKPISYYSYLDKMEKCKVEEKEKLQVIVSQKYELALKAKEKMVESKRKYESLLQKNNAIK